MTDIVDRLRKWTHSTDPVSACDLMDAAASVIERDRAEICRLRSLTRFQDNVIRSGDVACLTAAEKEAVEWAAQHLDNCGWSSVALRGLLERLGGER